MFDKQYLQGLVEAALKEDMPMGDITTDNIISEQALSSAYMITKEDGIIAGIDVCEYVFRYLDPDISIEKNISDGSLAQAGKIILEFNGRTRALLKAERTALNLLQRMSGIATKTYRLTREIADLKARVVDTRKTAPGLRMLEKYAVRMGGGSNHRFCLSDGVLIKDNHITAVGGIKEAVAAARSSIPHTIKIEVETENLDQVKEALEAGADIIMLDNMELETMREAVDIINGKALAEASGNVTIDTIRGIAETGVDIISVGGITHSVNALDISMKFLGA